jgi:hypothetical protein
MLKRFLKISYSIILIYSILMCKRDEITTSSSAKLTFSKKTITFDTVFTSIGSATRQFMVYNHNSKSINISEVKLAGDKNSVFKINVDGLAGPKVTNMEIRANDSAYIFVQVLIDPLKQNAPMLISDSLLFTVNGNIQTIPLMAWGQDVHLLKDSDLKTQTWTNDKPYLVYNTVVVDSQQTLTIQSGTIIYLHLNAVLIVNGTIISNGTFENPVVFRGDRLDTSDFSPPVAYNDIPGQWGEIWIRNSSTGNKLNYTTIKSAVNGLVVGDTSNMNSSPDLTMANCIIDNTSYAGIFATNANISAYNTLISNCSYFGFAAFNGGSYEFDQCTFVDYSIYGNSERYAVLLSNYLKLTDSTYMGELAKANFGNCIIYGNCYPGPELYLLGNSKTTFNYVFDHCLIKDANKTISVSDQTKFIKNFIGSNDDPGFQSLVAYKYNFRLKQNSFAIGAGDTIIGNKFPFDYYGNSRYNSPDIGAFQYVSTGSTK